MTGLGAPAFWWRTRPSTAALALAPLATLYGTVAARRMARPGSDIGVPVLCVGNFVVGGAGKTPTALALAGRLASLGLRPAFVSRGYGRTLARADAVIRVDPDRHGAAETGDEPLLLARVAPCWVASDRVAAARAAARDGATVIVMDDGLQSPNLRKDAVVAVVDGATGVGNGLCLPAGPLRAPLARQWRVVDVVVVIGEGAAGDAMAAAAGRHGVACARAVLEPDTAALAALRGRGLVAFAGIGRPGKFFQTLAEAALKVRERVPFPDHHVYTGRDRADLLARAARADATLVTTEKDLTRLPRDFPAAVLPVKLRFTGDDPAEAIARRLARHAVMARP